MGASSSLLIATMTCSTRDKKESGNKEITQLSARHVVRNDSETSHQLNVCVCVCVCVRACVRACARGRTWAVSYFRAEHPSHNHAVQHWRPTSGLDPAQRRVWTLPNVGSGPCPTSGLDPAQRRVWTLPSQ